MTTLQRDPTRYCTNVYMPIELAERIKTEIEGKKVPRKVRACTYGLKRKKGISLRPKTIGDFLVEIAEKKTRNTKVSSKAKRWGEAVLKKNRAARQYADAMHTKGKK